MIEKEEVKHIAKLARLELSENEIKKMQKDLSKILDYFDLLKKVPKSAKEKIIQADNKHLRKDEVKASQLSAEIVSLAPDKKDGYVRVKSIL
jgi:aspartyl-tRNA(Asn)/glutamyl-tRNA(Gln) amidotransferase subunit C